MNDKYYKVLNCTADSSDAEIESNYRELKAKYSEDRFLEGEKGNDAARKLTEIETAYNEIMSQRRESRFSSGSGDLYEDIEKLIKSGDLIGAQNKLDGFNERNAEWHYLQSVIFYKKNWSNESKKQLEIAMQMNPDNKKYKDSYDKLIAQINFNKNKTFNNWNESGSGNPNQAPDSEAQMGGTGCFEMCCQMALCNMLLNCCCNCH